MQAACLIYISVSVMAAIVVGVRRPWRSSTIGKFDIHIKLSQTRWSTQRSRFLFEIQQRVRYRRSRSRFTLEMYHSNPFDNSSVGYLTAGQGKMLK
jgi:hypothetical protein